MRYARMELGRPPAHFWAQWGDVPKLMEDWVQPPDHWKLVLYGHSGVARINGRLYEFGPGVGLVFPPYANCGHADTSSGTHMAGATFSMPSGSGQPHAVPLSFRAREDWYEDLWDAGERATEGAVRAKALVWHILWSVAQPPSLLRDQSLIYDAEDIVRARLAEPIRVPEIAEALDVSQSTLLAWFQAEHGTTVQGFVRQTRAREACRLLGGTDMRIKEIAAMVGVPDLQQFNKLVRSHSGLSPRQYREKSS